MPAPQADVWPRPPVEGVTPLLQPIAHVLIHAKAELPGLLAPLAPDDLYREPPGMASLAFQLAHMAGNIERLFTHARGRQLSDQQRQRLAAEGTILQRRPTLAELLGRLDIVMDDALAYLRRLDPGGLLDTRDIGVGPQFPTVFDLLSSAAEHTSRHMGQIATTAAFLRTSELPPRTTPR